MNKKILTCLLIGATAFGLNSCSSDKKSSSANSIEKYAPASKNTFIRVNTSEPETLDPSKIETVASAAIAYDIYEGLVSENQNNKAVPGVAKSWDISKDGTTYTFHIREDAKWSNGKPITAEDFVYSLQRAVNPKTASPMAYKLEVIANANQIMNGKLPINKLGVKALNEHTLQIKLNHPVYYFLGIMADPVTFPVYKEGVEKYGEKYFRQPNFVSNGAYTLKQWIPNGYVLVSKNKDYWGAKNVAIQNVKFLPIEQETSALNAYASGEADYVTYVPKTNLKLLKKKYGSQLRITPWLELEYVDFNTTKKPFNNLDLRKALSLAIDRKTLADKVLVDDSQPAYIFFPEDIESGAYKNIEKYKWANWTYAKKLALAKELYKKAGYSKENPLVIDYDYNTSNKNKKLVEAIAQMWHQALGVKVSISNSEFKVFIKTRNNKEYNGIARDGWVADYNAIDNFATLYTCDSPQNHSGFCNKEYDKLVEEGQNQSTSQEAKPYYTKAFELIQNDYPIAPIVVQPVIHLIKPYVAGYNEKGNHLDHIYDKWLSFKYAPKK